MKEIPPDGAATGDPRRDQSRPASLQRHVYTLTLAEHGAQVVNAGDGDVAPETMTLNAFDAAFRVWVAQHRTA